MKKAATRTNLANRSLPTLVAVGGSLAAFPVTALELGELTVHSHLGQPLRASIAYALAPHEQLSDRCVALRPGRAVGGIPGIGNATLDVTTGVIMLTSNTAVREPMVSAHIVIDCPYTAKLSREYVLFIDPAAPVDEHFVVTEPSTPDVDRVAAAPVVEKPAVAAIEDPVRTDIDKSTRYRVQLGDTVSEIAQRINNRTAALWPAVNAIFAANPGAFMNNDPNQLKAGSWLTIPSFDGNVAVIKPVLPVAESIEAAAIIEPAVAIKPVTVIEPVTVIVEETIESVADMGVTTNDLRPGDIVLNGNPVLEPIAATENIILPDTTLESPVTTSSSPNVPTAIITSKGSSDDGAASVSWLMWLAGSGMAIIIGLLMFGRRLRNRAAPAPLAPPTEQPDHARLTDAESDAEIGVDYNLADESPTEENLVLDVDLEIGSGLEDGVENDVSQDFGFAATTELDIELPFEPVSGTADMTDILPSPQIDESSILKSEVMPDDDEYDMSVIVDATKIPRPQDVTERDLKAVEITTDDDAMTAEHYTINNEVDYHILEQDYEDEMTATQALNQEIARAAAELAGRMEDESSDESSDDSDETNALPLASVTELDITAQMTAQNDELSDLDDTGINEAVTISTLADDGTVEMPAKSGNRS
ncbi:MAG: hypothetical protein IH913_06430 [Proteobacteria bacterium]|nr:hypothetical protein [Pseudomonadota bacterium]